MAKLVPSREIIDSDDFQPKLDQAEEKLLTALCRVLDDKWTIYVQPFLNGLHPDFVLFNPDSGIKIIEVKALDYSSYVVEAGGYRTKNQKSGLLQSAFSQVKQYKNALVKLEAPWIAENIALQGNKAMYALVECFVFFDRYTSQRSREFWMPLALDVKQHVSLIGAEHLEVRNENELRKKLQPYPRSLFAEFMSTPIFQNVIHSALGYPEIGDLPVSIFDRLSADQRKYAVSKNEYKHIKGAAGSGKTLVLAARAADAVISGKKVLVTCYNITMRNYLRDAVMIALRARKKHRIEEGLLKTEHYHMELCRQLGNGNPCCNRGAHDDQPDDGFGECAYQELSKLRKNGHIEREYDAIFVDEGQDFHPRWIECLEMLLSESPQPRELVVMSDPAQNIYVRQAQKVQNLKGFIGKPPVLRASYRLRGRLADVARFWYESKFGADTDTKPEYQSMLFGEIAWHDCSDEQRAAEKCTAAVKNFEMRGVSRADIAVVGSDTYVCRSVLAALERQLVNVQHTMLNVEEQQKIEKKCMKLGENERRLCIDRLKREIERPRKLQFGRKSGMVKVTTVHSFKGWEWSHIIFLASFEDAMQGRDEIMYTAFTRAQQSLTVINCMPEYVEFGRLLASEGLLTDES